VCYFRRGYVVCDAVTLDAESEVLYDAEAAQTPSYELQVVEAFLVLRYELFDSVWLEQLTVLLSVSLVSALVVWLLPLQLLP